MDENLLWIEALPTHAVAGLIEALCKLSMATEFHRGMTDGSWWPNYLAMVEELTLRNDQWVKENGDAL